MTTFERSGHYRTSQTGVSHWVESHSVSRDTWPSGLTRPVRQAYSAQALISVSENITIPNARCPGCGSPVFFFAAANGGRVFFNALGSPWDKHDCGHLDYSWHRPFDNVDDVLRWQRGRRALHPTGTLDQSLGLTPGTTRATARVLRRSGTSIVILSHGSDDQAYVVDAPWTGSDWRTVYVRRTDAAEMPTSLDWLDDDLEPISVKLLAQVPVPGPPSPCDMPEIADEHMPEVTRWAHRHLRHFEDRRHVRIGGHRIGVVGNLHGSRCAVMPLAPAFTTYTELWPSRAERDAACEQVIVEWTKRVIGLLDRKASTLAHPLCRDQVIWLVPWLYDDHSIEVFVDCIGRRGQWALGEIEVRTSSLPPSHRVFDLSEAPDIDWRDLRTSFADLKKLEDRHIQTWMRSTTEKQWLAACLRRAGLGEVVAALKGEGVTFPFGIRPSHCPGPWYQHAILPDGEHLLVVLHRSDAEQGLCFAHFDRGRWLRGKGYTHSLEALFCGKRLSTIRDELKRQGAR